MPSFDGIPFLCMKVFMKAYIRRYLVALLCWGCLIAPISSWAEENTVELSVAGKAIQAEVALTQPARAMGLMHREALCENCGMLFVFPYADKWAFWSKNTPLALSVAFIDEAGCIVQIVDMEPNSTQSHAAGYAVIYALEMSRGWFAKNGIATGNSIDGLVRNQKTGHASALVARKECA